MSKIILVTGASKGIGAATALAAARQGYHVAVHYNRDEAGATSVVQQIKAEGGCAHIFQADVSQETAVEQMFRDIDRVYGPLQALVNNAGTLEHQSRFVDMEAARWMRILGTNLIGPMLCAREAIKRMSTRLNGQGGSIVNVTSTAIRQGAPGEYIDYAVSKGGLETFTIGLAKEVAGEGIRVNAVRPGIVYTTIHALGGEPGRVDRVKSTIPMGRGGQPKEVAQAILWLLSADASYSTGAILDVSGGR